MLSFILAVFPTLASWINGIVGWIQGKVQAQDAAVGSEETSESQHQNDGSQSVADQTSTDAQTQALNQLDAQEDNPSQVVVALPKGNP